MHARKIPAQALCALATILPAPNFSNIRHVLLVHFLSPPPAVSQTVEQIQTQIQDQIQRTPILVIGVLDLCLSLAFAVLFIAARDFKVFRAASIFLFLGALVEFADYAGPGPFVELIRPIPAIFAVETALEALDIRRRFWARLIWPITAVALLLSLFPSMAFARAWPFLLAQPIFLGIIIIGFRRRDLRDRLVAAAYTGVFLARATLSPLVQHLTGFHSIIAIRGWEWPILPAVVTVFGFVTLAIFVRDLVHDRRDKQRLAADLEAARLVQQALIPTHIPHIPGFQIANVYRPFGEVGGDFFQILPLPNGGVLIAIGDVSGKGMPAAMTVSLLIGTLLTLSESIDSPAQLLAGLNHRAISRSSSGFTTCLILRIARDGAFTVANAGHLPPYLNGKEIACDNNLPLGLVPGVEYAETRLQLNANEQLTLLTDGILEATNATGELFGFDRTAAVSIGSAERISQAAQAWGQEDDITVLTIRAAAL